MRSFARPLIALAATALLPVVSAAQTVSSSTDPVAIAPETRAGSDPLRGAGLPPRPIRHFGIAVTPIIGLNGIGGEVFVPVSRFLGARVGGTYFRYSSPFQEDAATIDASIHIGAGKLQADIYPFGGGFRVSPLVLIGNQTRVGATVNINPNQQFDLDGHTYQGSASDPLHGLGRVDTNRIAPGAAIGWGNPTRSRHRISFPTEIGFYYVGQPKLQVNFTGTVCEPSLPASIGCLAVQDQPEFRTDLNRFIQRNNHNLTYAKFLPILNFGVAYRF